MQTFDFCKDTNGKISLIAFWLKESKLWDKNKKLKRPKIRDEESI
jgi:hypothetical protein